MARRNKVTAPAADTVSPPESATAGAGKTAPEEPRGPGPAHSPEDVERIFPIGVRVWCVVPDGPVPQWTRGNVDSYGKDMADAPVVWVTVGNLPNNDPVPFQPSQLQVLP